MCIVKDLEFPKLSALGAKRFLVEDCGARTPKDAKEFVRGAKRQRRAENESTQISDQYERVAKLDHHNLDREDSLRDIDASQNNKVASGNDTVESENGAIQAIKGPDSSLGSFNQQHNTSAMDRKIGSSDQISPKVSNKKDSFTQTDGHLQIPSPEHQISHPDTPSLSPSDQVQQTAPSNEVFISSTNEPESIPRAPDSYAPLLGDHANFDRLTITSDPQLTNLDALIRTCATFIPSKPVRPCLPLSIKAAQCTDPPTETTQTVIDTLIQSPAKNHKDIWICPIRESNTMRYVSGPLLKNTCGLKYREDMAEMMTSHTQTLNNHPLRNTRPEGIDNVILRARIPPSLPIYDISMPVATYIWMNSTIV